MSKIRQKPLGFRKSGLRCLLMYCEASRNPWKLQLKACFIARYFMMVGGQMEKLSKRGMARQKCASCVMCKLVGVDIVGDVRKVVDEPQEGAPFRRYVAKLAKEQCVMHPMIYALCARVQFA